MNSPPTLADVARHEAHGGLWRVVPVAQGGVQQLPLFVRLTVEASHGKLVFASVNKGGSVHEFVKATGDNRGLTGAAWTPCDLQGDRMAT